MRPTEDVVADVLVAVLAAWVEGEVAVRVGPDSLAGERVFKDCVREFAGAGLHDDEVIVGGEDERVGTLLEVGLHTVRLVEVFPERLAVGFAREFHVASHTGVGNCQHRAGARPDEGGGG